MTHTPGPWTVNPDNSTEVLFGGDSDVDGCDLFFTDEQTAEANARLIAAAPELLAALMGMEAHFGPLDDNPMMNDDVRKCFGMARAAIAKATGAP